MSADEQSEREQFLKLFLEHEHELRAMVWAMIFRAGDREDVFQNVAVVLWDKFDRFDRDRSFLPWARGVAIREIRKHRQKDVRRRSLLSDSALESLTVAYEQSEPLSTDRLAALRTCMQKLPEKSGELVKLYYLDHHRGPDLASMLGLSLDAVYQNLSRLRRRLATCIKLELDAPQGPTRT